MDEVNSRRWRDGESCCDDGLSDAGVSWSGLRPKRPSMTILSMSQCGQKPPVAKPVQNGRWKRRMYYNERF